MNTEKIRGRLVEARANVEAYPFSHPVATGWYLEDVLALVADREALLAERDALSQRVWSYESQMDDERKWKAEAQARVGVLEGALRDVTDFLETAVDVDGYWPQAGEAVVGARAVLAGGEAAR